MASIVRNIAKGAKKVAGAGANLATTATRLSTNPLYRVTDKLVDKVVPGYSGTVNTVLKESSNPFSSLNTGLTQSAIQVNPVKATQQAVNAVTSTLSTGNTQKRVIPDRASYSANAGASAAAAAANAAAAKVEAEKLRVIPDRASYSANAGANANIAANNAKVRTDEERAAAESRGKAWDNASTGAAVRQAERAKESPDPAREALVIKDVYPNQTESMKYYADLARYDNMQNQNLPEVVVESDYKKYLIFGGLTLLAIIAWKKIK
jgi:hypothetical protein